MDDHHFSYPRVVPLRETAISAHATQPPAALRPAEPPVQYTPGPAPAVKNVTLAA